MGDAEQAGPTPAKPPAGEGEQPESAKKYWWAGAIAVPLIVAAVSVLPSLLKKDSPGVQINSDSHDFNFQQVNIIEREYQQKMGQPLPPDLRQQLEQALALVKKKKFEAGIQLYKAVAEKAPIASVLADWGNALMAAGKSTEAEAVLNKAADLDPSNPQVARGQQFIGSLKGNNSILTPAVIEVGAAITSTLLDHDEDHFVFVAPQGPRDYASVTLINKSQELAMALNARGPNKEKIGGGANGGKAADVTYEFPTTPGAKHFLEVMPHYTGGGTYTLSVTALHRFDRYEPNDTVFTPKEISVGEAVEANILDGNDTDFYRFRAKGTKTMVSAENRSPELGIAVAVTNADQAPVGHGNNGPKAANVRYEFDSTPGAVYQVQISPYYSGGGKYVLTVR